MPELRRDPITHRWAIIATERALRPKQVEAAHPPPSKQICPFCPGHEGLTPTAIATVGDPWRVRVVPNKYPALRIEGGLDRRPHGIYDQMNGVGAHEVIIEGAAHDFTWQGLDPKHRLDVLRTYRDRVADLARDQRFACSLLFRNHGAEAGATMAHGHAQLIALPVVPLRVQELLDGSRRYFEFRERNVFDDMIGQEVEDSRRLVADNGEFVLIAPYASERPFELWLVPRAAESHFERTSDDRLAAMGELLATALDRLDRGLGGPAYNFIIQSAPYRVAAPWYRWHVQIAPKLATPAGFEWGSGFSINPTAPEEAAAFLRDQ